MREDHEELILRNPGFAACALWHLSRSYADGADGRSPTLAHMALGTAMLFHGATVEKISGMRFESGLLKAVSDMPELVAGVQPRLEAALHVCLIALQVGVAAQMLCREGGTGLPTFRALGTNLPKQVRTYDAVAGRTNLAARRLGAWFAAEDLATVRGRMGVKF